MKKFLQSYFGFTKKELNGILVLCLLLILIVTFPVVYDQFAEPKVYDLESFGKEVNQFLASAESANLHHDSSTREGSAENNTISYFQFDPNELDDASWRKLGLSIRQISVIRNYEAKGGHFYTKADLKKIYSISNGKYSELEPYIVIRKVKKFEGKDFDRPKHVPAVRKDLKAMVELNNADSAELESIKGIGPAFASRIVRFRTKLGGFYSKEQLRDIYGIDSLKYEELKNQVKVDPALVQKINVNKVSFDEIKRHPYLTYKQMNAIIQYRKQHGVYLSIQDLKKIAILNDEILRKIEPYLIFNDPNQT